MNKCCERRFNKIKGKVAGLQFFICDKCKDWVKVKAGEE